MTQLWGPEALAQAAARLRAGGLVAFPTETVYGLGALAGDPAAVAALYAAKGRPAFNPLIVHAPDAQAAAALVALDAEGAALAAAFWPGPLTLVAPLRPGADVCAAATAGLATAAVRVPAHPLALALLRAVGRPVAAPSANPSGGVSPTTAAHVLAGLGGRIAGVLDGGPCAVGIESTIVALGPEGPILLRPGGASAEALARVLGRPLRPPEPAGPAVDTGAAPPLRALAQPAPIAPGQLASHYAPGALVRLDATGPAPGEAWLGFGPDPAGVVGPALNLSPGGDAAEAAANLYAHLRALDVALGGRGTIAVAAIPGGGLAAAIRDRLRRAAAPR